MRKIFYILSLFLLTAILFSASLVDTPAWAEPVTIKGQRLAEISDIVSTVTESDFPEIPKHSLLLFERTRLNSNQMRFQSHVFTISSDGSLLNENATLDNYDSEYLPVASSTGVIERMDVSVSPKRFGNRLNVVFATAGISSNYNSRYGLQTVESSGSGSSAQISQIMSDYDMTDDNRNAWGNACLSVEGMEDKDVFVIAHSSKMDTSGNLYLKFVTVNRNESGDNGVINDLNVDGGDSQGWKAFDYSNGIRGVDVAAGDIDGDGHRNEIALAWTQNDSSWMYVFQVKKSGDSVSVTKLLEKEVNNGDGNYGDRYYMDFRQACPNVVTGDFDGDGRDEAAFVGRIYYYSMNCMRVHIEDYNPDNGGWNNDEYMIVTEDVTMGVSLEYGTAERDNCYHAPCKATRCDFDGDGKDEIAILFFVTSPADVQAISGGPNKPYYPRLERWYCDQGSIKPKRDTSHIKGGADDASLLGYNVENTNDYYKIVEEFSITAGPLTGRKGKVKLIEDVAISYVNSDRSSVYVIPTQLDSNREFAGFGETKTIFNVEDSSEGRRGGLVTADFANESLMLDKPSHVQDDHDESYVAVIQALPYHVDNVDQNGNLTAQPINYTFSGFGDNSDNIKGDMSVSYTTTQTSSEQKNVSFGLASTTETISVLGKAGPYVQGYLKFRTMGANIAGNFDPRVKAAAGAMNEMMNFVTDKIDKTTTDASSSAQTASISTTLQAKQFDALITYTAPQHIWRYKILNKPLPSWYVLGPRADYSSKDFSSEAESQDHYVTFSMYDAATPSATHSDGHYAYQARHEEGNFFSYPSLIQDIEGYTSGGDLVSSPYSAAWDKSESGMTVNFETSKIDNQKYDENVQKSTLSKTISAIASFFGAKDPTGLPPYTSHSESFVKSYSSQEAIDIKVYGKTTLPGEAAGHTLMAMPYTAREGTLKVGTAVQLTNVGLEYGPALWYPQSRYSKHTDPSLVLPRKYVMCGASLIANDQRLASLARGIRYYVPALDLDSDKSILGGLEYKISIPIYNASFVDTGDFEVRLSYVEAKDFDISKPNSKIGNLTHIGTVTMSLKGWKNDTRLNKGWADFTWNVPDNLSDGSYYLYVQIDPDNKVKDEVHESRLASDDTVRDVGGNNEGYYVFDYTSPGTLVNKQNDKASGAFKAAAHSGNGTILRTAYRNGESDGGVHSAMTVYDTTGTLSVKAKVEGYEGIEILYLLELFAEIAALDSRDSIPVECELEYKGDEYYHEAYFYGVRYKPGALDSANGDFSKISDDAVKDYFMVEKVPLVPGNTVKFVMSLHSGDIDWENGSGFQLVVPELAAYSFMGSNDVDGGSGSGGDTGSDGGSQSEETESGREITVLPSSSGGCEAGTGIFAVMLLSGALIFRTMKRR